MPSSEEGPATLDNSGRSQIALQQSAVPADTESGRQLPTSPCSVVDADDLGCEQPVPESPQSPGSEIFDQEGDTQEEQLRPETQHSSKALGR